MHYCSYKYTVFKRDMKCRSFLDLYKVTLLSLSPVLRMVFLFQSETDKTRKTILVRPEGVRTYMTSG